MKMYILHSICYVYYDSNIEMELHRELCPIPIDIHGSYSPTTVGVGDIESGGNDGRGGGVIVRREGEGRIGVNMGGGGGREKCNTGGKEKEKQRR